MKNDALRSILQVVKEFRKLHAEMPSLTQQVFLEVALEEGISITEVSNRLGVSLAAASRNVALLSKTYQGGRPGVNLVNAVPGDNDPRTKAIRLTPKGRMVADSLSDLIERSKQ